MSSVSTRSELFNRLIFTLVLLAVYRVGVHIPVPGVNGAEVLSFFKNYSSGVLGLFNTFSGGALMQFSIFALGIMPYISSSIIFQLLSSSVPALEALKKEGDSGRKKINQYTRYLTIILSIIQSLGISSWLLSSSGMGGKPLVINGISPLEFKLLAITTLTAGTAFVMWLGEQISDRGIGNGSSLIIFTGIASSIPSGATKLFTLLNSDEVSLFGVIATLIFMLLIILFVVYFEVAQRRIPISYSQRLASPVGAHLPIKLNFSGVIPPIFASSLLMFPATIFQFTNSAWLKGIQESLSPTGVLYNILFAVLIVFFCFFYSEVVFNVSEISDGLRKNGGFIPGIRAGKTTVDFIETVLSRLNVVGSSYLVFICILPGVLMNTASLPFYFGGTSLLILVGVAMDTAQQIQGFLLNSKYSSSLKGNQVLGRRVKF